MTPAVFGLVVATRMFTGQIFHRPMTQSGRSAGARSGNQPLLMACDDGKATDE
jgi:hypothetical protein